MAPGTLAALLLTIAGWTESPLFRPLFTPPRAPAGMYRTYVRPEPIDDVLARMQAGVEAQAVVPAEAFGQSGGYNRWKLALLYGGKRAKVARMPQVENGRVVEAWTLISPYPDAKLERLEQGTLLIVLRLP
jgi:hypothetical protein